MQKNLLLIHKASSLTASYTLEYSSQPSQVGYLMHYESKKLA